MLECAFRRYILESHQRTFEDESQKIPSDDFSNINRCFELFGNIR